MRKDNKRGVSTYPMNDISPSDESDVGEHISADEAEKAFTYPAGNLLARGERLDQAVSGEAQPAHASDDKAYPGVLQTDEVTGADGEMAEALQQGLRRL